MGPFPNNPHQPGPFPTNPERTGIPPTYAGGQGGPSWVPQGSGMLQPTPEWKSLRIIARILKIIAWVEAVTGALMIIGWTTLMGAVTSSVSGSGSSMSSANYYSAGSASSGMSGIAPYIGGTTAIVALYLLAETAIAFFLTYGVAEAIVVFLAIEKNTRKGG